MIGTTGQGYADGMRFLQFYYALPLAMIVLSVTLVPFFHNAKVYTAYEYLERRFDAKTRAFTSLLFLLSRSMSLGVVISAPAVVFSVVLGVDRDDDRAADWRADGGLHDVRRRAGGDLDRRQADGADRRRPDRGGCRADPRPAGRRQCVSGAAHRRRRRPPADVRLLVRPDQPVHVLVRHDRGACSCSAPTSGPTRARCSAI